MANENIENIVKQTTSNTIYQVHKGDYNELRYAANLFLNEVDKIAQRNHAIASQGTIKKEISDIYKYMKADTENTRQALQLQHIFEKQLNDFMGRTIYLTYVDTQGNLNVYDDANTGKLYSQAVKESKGQRGNISASKMFQTIDLQQDLKEKILISINKRKGVYQEAIRRWEKNKTQEWDREKIESGKEYYPSKNTFYWRLNDYHISGWTNPIQNRGWIAQGYAGAVINEDQSIVSLKLQLGLKNLWQNHISQDSIGGAIKGDIVYKENGDIQFAVKSGTFSTARFGQFVRLAYNILQIQLLTPQQFQKALPALVNFRKITNDIIEAARKKGQQEIIYKIGKQTYKIILGS